MPTVMPALAIWGVFVCAIVVMSILAHRRPVVRRDFWGAFWMEAQYTLFFSILTYPLVLGVAPPYPGLATWGYGVVLVGLALNLIARFHLQRWGYSPSVTVRQGQALCTTGAFRWVRHPLYTTQMVMMVGTALAVQHPAYLVLPLAFVATVVVAKREEALLETVFEDYAAYKKRTRMFIPFVV